MLKGVDPCPSAGILAAPRAMGHGDMLAVVDATFPAAAVAQATAAGRTLPIAAATTGAAVAAILTLLPLEPEGTAALRMEVAGDPAALPPAQAEIRAAIDAAEGRPRPMGGLDRLAFYDRAREAFAVVQTLERRFYGNVPPIEGTIPPDR